MDFNCGFGILGHVRRCPPWDGWSWPSRAGTKGTPKHVHQSVVQNVPYDVCIKFDVGVLGHQGMGLTRWPMWGSMELAIWSKTWIEHPTTCAETKSGAMNIHYDVVHQVGFGVQGDLGMGLTMWVRIIGHCKV